MARDLSIVIADKEEIISYECHLPNKTVRVLVGIGNVGLDSEFIPQPNQTYKLYTINNDKYTTLLGAKEGKPAGTFRKDDLWDIIDIINTEESALLVDKKA